MVPFCLSAVLLAFGAPLVTAARPDSLITESGISDVAQQLVLLDDLLFEYEEDQHMQASREEGQGVVGTIVQGNAPNTDGVTVVTPQRASLPGSDGGLDGSEGGAEDGGNAGDVGNDDEAGGARLSMASSGTGSCSEFPPLVQKMIKLDSQERLQMNIAPLTCDDDLGDIAFKWSKQQCEDGHTSHDGRDSRCESSGYESCGENVAYNAPPQLDVTVPKTHLNWMDEAEHRDNILNSDFSRVGYGWYVCKEVGEDGSGSVFWTAFFGKP